MYFYRFRGEMGEGGYALPVCLRRSLYPNQPDVFSEGCYFATPLGARPDGPSFLLFLSCRRDPVSFVVSHVLSLCLWSRSNVEQPKLIRS